MSEWYIRREYNIGGVMPRAEVCERGADPFHVICEALPEVARQIVADHEDAARLRAALEDAQRYLLRVYLKSGGNHVKALIALREVLGLPPDEISEAERQEALSAADGPDAGEG